MSDPVSEESPQPNPTTRRRFLFAAAALPAVAAAPFVVGRLLDSPPEGPVADGPEVRITSIDGRYQALADPLAPGASIYNPGGRSESTIAVRDQLTGSVRTIQLPRNLEPEAFSPDGTTLFAIDHRPPQDPKVYRVSTIDIATATVTDTLGPQKTGVLEEMRGSGRQQVWSPLRDQLYTLYIRQHHTHREPIDAAHAHAGEPVDAFVHVLDVVNDWALCVDLPAGIGLGPSATTAIMIDESGTTVTVVDHALHARVEVTRIADTEESSGQFAVSDLLAIEP